MNERIIALFTLLQDAPDGVKLSQLAANLDVAERTVRRYIQQLNEMLHDVAQVVSDRPGMYQLEIYDANGLQSFAERSQVISDIPDTPRERVAYLINDLLTRNDWVTLDTLASILYVSRRTVSSDLRDVEEILAPYNLTLVSRPYRGLKVSGSEVDRRLCLANVSFLSALNADNLKSQDITLQAVGDCVAQALAHRSVEFSSVNYRNLLVHLAIAVIRIRSGAYIPIEGNSLGDIKQTEAYAIAQDIAAALSAQFYVDLPEEEIAYIALHLAGKQNVTFTAAQVSAVNGKSPFITDEVWTIVSEMVEAVWRIYLIDFRDDLELRMNLARHIAPLIIRLQHRMVAENPLLDETKARFPLAWSMALDASLVLEQRFGTSLAAAEIGYLALAFALAIERLSSSPVRKNVLIVCASGVGTARLLEYRCRREFGPFVDEIVTCDVGQVNLQDFSKIDYVFTTVPLPVSVPVPVREVNAFFDDADIAGIMELFRHDHPSDLLRFFPRELFFAHMKQQEKDSVLEALIDRATSLFNLDGSFRSLVFEREAIAPTAFGNRVALPHPARSIGGTPFVAVGLLDAPLMWGAHEVQAVFLISFSDDSAFKPEAFNDGIAALLSCREAIDRLLRERSYTTLNALLHAAGASKY